MIIKKFNEFEGVWEDITGTTGQTLRFGATGKIDTSVPQWGDIGGNINDNTTLKNTLDGYVEKNGFTDWTQSAVFSGFSSLNNYDCRYAVIGNVYVFHFRIDGDSNNNDFSVTLPFTNGGLPQHWVCFATDDSTKGLCTAELAQSSSELKFYWNHDLGNNATWTNTGTKSAYGVITIVNV